RNIYVLPTIVKKAFYSGFNGLLAILLVGTAFLLSTSPQAVSKVFAWQQSKDCPSCHMPVEDHYLNFAYFVESGDLTSTLVLNNNTLDPQNVRVNVFNYKGQLFSQPLSLPAGQVTRLNVKDLLKDVPGDFSSGNIQVFYHAIGMGVTGQVTITSARQRYSF